MIAFRQVSKVYKIGGERIFALRDAKVELQGGEFTAVLGPSGSGKSTFMHLCGGLDRPTSGRIEYRGENIGEYDDKRMSHYRNRAVGFVFQSFNLDPGLTALENTALPLLYAGIPRRDRERRAREALYRMGLADRCSHRPTELSGGQRQRVSIARAIVNRPDIILADEPTGNLDTASGGQVLELLRELARGGYAVVMVTHNPDQAARCDRVLEIVDGILRAK